MEGKQQLSPKFLDLLSRVKAKRPRTVIEHILKQGFITTEELKDTYGYNHPPRAARDVREQGIPLETFSTTDKDGRKIAAYRFGDPSKIRQEQLGGRQAFPKAFKEVLLRHYGSRCRICFTPYDRRYLQIDHRVPYLVFGEPTGDPDTAEFMLVCASCNRAKSWSCEHCQNGMTDHMMDICQTCYWASPEQYTHIALRLIRRLDLTWVQDEARQYDRLVQLSRYARKSVPEFVKDVLRRVLQEKGEI